MTAKPAGSETTFDAYLGSATRHLAKGNGNMPSVGTIIAVRFCYLGLMNEPQLSGSASPPSSGCHMAHIRHVTNYHFCHDFHVAAGWFVIRMPVR
ncbi:hypothetical protein [Sphingobium sp. RAC03]|uniref:hypothetical protein n=1 Tax=Sphingobium sp. RAC03 TaxID=1843368 RepID=UPI0012371D8B|nr:hypothetical protein [Sphingobium sp. RAC03]